MHDLRADYDAAIASYEKALALDPSHVHVAVPSGVHRGPPRRRGGGDEALRAVC